MILSSIASGLPCSRSCARWMAFSRSRMSCGTSSRRMYFGFPQAMCIPRSFTSSWNFAFRAVKSVSQFTSTSTPTLPPMWMYVPAAAQLRLAHHLDLRPALARGDRAPFTARAAPARTAPAAAALAAPLAGRVPILAWLRLGSIRFLLPAVCLVARLPLDRGVGDLVAEQPDGADRVVVPRDHVVDALGIAVGIDERHDGDAEPHRLVHRDVLLLRIDHEQAPRQAGHLLDAAQVLLQLVHLVLEDRHF